MEYNYNALDDKYLGFGRDFRQTTRSTGFFFQNEWRSERLNFLVGGRVDKHNMMKNAVFSPRVNVRYSPTPADGLRASYASGYRAPQAYNEDLHIDALDNKVAVIRLDPNLRPEYSHSLSASVDLYRNFGRVQGNLLVEGFYTVLDDLFTLEKVGEDEQGNVIKERRNAAAPPSPASAWRPRPVFRDVSSSSSAIPSSAVATTNPNGGRTRSRLSGGCSVRPTITAT